MSRPRVSRDSWSHERGSFSDVFPTGVCPYDLELKTNECFVIHGQMTIVARETDDLNYTIGSIRQAINTSMTNDELLGPDLPTVVKVTYIGEFPPSSTLPFVQVGGNDEDDGGLPIILGVAATAAAFLILLLWGRRRRVVTKGDDEAAIIAAGAATSEYAGGDPPGSFHYGKYHYSREGERYLSNHCPECQETLMKLRRDNGLESIDEQSELHGWGLLVAANSKDLGGRHSGIDVHICGSGTCKECMLARNDVLFLPLCERNGEGCVPASLPISNDIVVDDETASI